MAEGTRLKDLNEHLKAMEEKMQTLTTDCNQVWENKFQQFETEYNRRLGVVVQQLDEMQRESQQRYEAQQIESTRRHEQLLKLFNSLSPVVKSTSQASIPVRDNKSTFEFPPSSSFRSTNHEERGKGILPIPQGGYEGNFGNQGQRNSYYVPHPKLDYPTFEGEEPREWMKKSEQYFKIY